VILTDNPKILIRKMSQYRRKMTGFFSICAIAIVSVWKHGINWPTAGLLFGAFLVLCGSISTEKLVMKWLEKR
jgi:hypothetical protein